MNLVRLLYASRFVQGIGPSGVRDIQKVSRENNARLGITGVLCYDPHFFLQYLEGPREAVNRLYGKIMADPRHSDVVLIAYSDIHRREFENWSMAYVRASELNKSIILKFSASETFDPFSMTGEQALGFIAAILEESEKFLKEAAEEVKKRRR